jgi:hypothetical protein
VIHGIRAAAVAAVLSCASAVVPAGADQATPGLIVARTRPTLVLLWNTNAAAAAAASSLHGDALVREIVAQAAQIVADRAKAAAPETSEIELDLLYAAPGGTDPRYNVDTLGNIARVGRLSASATEAASAGDGWATAVRGGHPPKALHVTLDQASLAPLRDL